MTAEIRSLVGLRYLRKPFTQKFNECVNGVPKGGQRKFKSITDGITVLQCYLKKEARRFNFL